MLPDGVQKIQYHADDTVLAKTWWQTKTLPPLDYSYVLELTSPNGTVFKQDAGLTANSIPTSQWQPDQPYRLSQISFTLPSDLAPGEYTVTLGVYFWQDPQPLAVKSSSDAPGILAEVGTVTVVG